MWWERLPIPQIARDQGMAGPRKRRCICSEVGLSNLFLVFIVFPIAVAHACRIVLPFIPYIGLDCGRVHIWRIVVICCPVLEVLRLLCRIMRMLEMLRIIRERPVT